MYSCTLDRVPEQHLPVGPSPGLVKLGLWDWGFLYVIMFEVVFLWDLAEQGPTPKDIQCLKNWGRNFEICENSDVDTWHREKNVKKPWKASENPVKRLWKTHKIRIIRFVQEMQKEWLCDFVTNFSHECSRSMWMLLILRCGNFVFFNVWVFGGL